MYLRISNLFVKTLSGKQFIRFRETGNNDVRNIPKHNSPKTCQAQHCDVSGAAVGNELDHVMLSKYRNGPIGKDHFAPIGETSYNISINRVVSWKHVND